MLDWKFVAVWTGLFAGALLTQAALFTTHGRWNNVLPILLFIGLWIGATLHATDRQSVWWRRIVGAALNVGLAVGIAMIPYLFLTVWVERGANLDDALVAAVAVPLGAALLTAILAALKVSCGGSLQLCCAALEARPPNQRLELAGAAK